MQKADGQGLASNAYGSGWFRVGQDEALVIEMDTPDVIRRDLFADEGNLRYLS